MLMCMIYDYLLRNTSEIYTDHISVQTVAVSEKLYLLPEYLYQTSPFHSHPAADICFVRIRNKPIKLGVACSRKGGGDHRQGNSMTGE